MTCLQRMESEKREDKTFFQKNWFAIRTRIRHEKVVRDRLAQQGFEYILPGFNRLSQWKDRKKLIEVPLFPGYCFARFSAQERIRVLQAPGVLYIVGGGVHHQSLTPEEIETLKKLARSGLSCEPYPYLSNGVSVEIIRGPLSGVRGRLIRRESHSYVVIGVELIKQGATVRINTRDIVPISNTVEINEIPTFSPRMV